MSQAGNVSVAGGGGAAIQTLTVQAASAPGLTTVSPITGNVTVNASAVAPHSVPIETRSRALGAYNIEVQESAAVASTDATKSGICHFNSSQFSVDANGFVSSTSVSALSWSDKAVSYAATSNNGYVSTAVVTASLPAAGAANGTTIAFQAGTADAHTISPDTTDKIRIANKLSTNGTGAGKVVSTAIGDSLTLVYNSASGIWIALSNNGNWTVI